MERRVWRWEGRLQLYTPENEMAGILSPRQGSPIRWQFGVCLMKFSPCPAAALSPPRRLESDVSKASCLWPHGWKFLHGLRFFARLALALRTIHFDMRLRRLGLDRHDKMGD